MGHAPTVVFEDVAVLRETALAITCRIAGESHALALGRLQRGSTVKHAGDHGVLVLTQNFAAERGIGVRPWARCAGVRRDSLPCGAFPHSGSRFCLAHEPTIAGEPTAPRTLPRADSPRPNRCESRRSDGLPCRGLQRPGRAFCYSHDPATAEPRRIAEALAVAARDARRDRQQALLQPLPERVIEHDGQLLVEQFARAWLAPESRTRRSPTASQTE